MKKSILLSAALALTMSATAMAQEVSPRSTAPDMSLLIPPSEACLLQCKKVYPDADIKELQVETCSLVDDTWTVEDAERVCELPFDETGLL